MRRVQKSPSAVLGRGTGLWLAAGDGSEDGPFGSVSIVNSSNNNREGR